MKPNRSFLVLFFAVAALISLCSPGRAADAHDTFKVGDFTFARPASWEWVVPASSMRKAQLAVKDTAGKDTAEVTFFQFAGGAGTVQANVDRWFGQFEEPKEKLNSKVEEVTVGKTKITYVSAEGTFKSGGMMGGPTTNMPNYALLGAIVASSDGDIFVKMTGPKALVKTATADFKKMIESGPKAAAK